MEADFDAGVEEVGRPIRRDVQHHPEYVDALRHDPLVYRGAVPRQTMEAISRTWPEVASAVAEGRPSVPTLILHGEKDQIVPVEHSRAIVAQLPRATLRVFPGDLHDILNEHDRDAVHDVVAEFVGAQVGRAAVQA